MRRLVCCVILALVFAFGFTNSAQAGVRFSFGVNTYGPYGGYRPGYNPYGGYRGYNPYGGYRGYNPYGGYRGYNPYGGYPGYNPYGYNPYRYNQVPTYRYQYYVDPFTGRWEYRYWYGY